MKNKGFTLIEFIIILSLIAIAGSLIARVVIKPSNGSIISRGATATVEMRCINGLKFLVGYYGFTQQVIGPDGKPAVCQ